MSVQLIYGKSGTGKSEYIYNSIKNKINVEKIYIITPEQFSFNAEKRLLDTLGTISVINAEVLSFNRMANRVLKATGNQNQKYLTKHAKAMIMYYILKNNQKELKFLKKPDANISVAVNAITEFKKHNVKVNELQEVQIEDKYLKNKVEDLAKLYNAYQEYIENRCIDENDIINLLALNIENTEEFKNSIIYIDEFVGFTEQEYMVIKKLINIAKEVIITIPAEVEYDTNLEELKIEDIFYESKKTARNLIKLAKEENVEIIKPVILKQLFRLKNEELKFLEQNIYSNTYKVYNNNTKDISLFLGKNRYSEIEYLAKRIIELVKYNGYEYRDISIITNNISIYSSIAKVIFAKYEIPLFIDEKKELNQNQLAQYVLSLVDLIETNWTYDKVFNYLKNSYSGLDKDIVNKLENYCLKWGIKNNKWIEEWKYDDRLTESLEPIRSDIVNKINNLKQNIIKAKSFNNITKQIYSFIMEQEIEKKIDNKINMLNKLGKIDLINEYKSSFNTIISIFDEIVEMFGNSVTTIDQYKDILKIGLDNIDIGEIPARIDQVIMGDVERSKSHKVKSIFITGLNDGVFPSVSKPEGFLNDSDRETLKETGMQLANGTIEQLYEEQLNIYKAFTTAEEELYLSYCSADNEGRALRQSILLTKIKKIFPKLKFESDVINSINEITTQESTFEEMLLNLRKAQDGEKIEDIWYEVYYWFKNNMEWKKRLDTAIKGIEYSNVSERISEHNIKALYGNTLNTTISRLEQYRKCPFSFHLKYGLNLAENQEFQIKPIDKGTFMHNVIDRFFESAKNIKEMTETEIKKLIQEIIESELQLPKNFIFTSSAKFRLLTQRLKKVIYLSVKNIIEQLKYSDFNILGNEVEFKNGQTYKPIEIILDNGKKVEITGKIDRVDLATSGNNKYIRIIDYKSSIKDIELNEVINGLQIQLITYLDSVIEIEQALAAGVLYFNLIDPIIKSSKMLTDEEINEQIKEQFKMKGLILADIKVIKMMDNRLQEGSSKVIPVTIKKDGEIGKTGGSTILQDDFDNLQKKVKKVISQLSKEILKGNIEIKPYKGAANAVCEYCSYKSICAFNPTLKDNEYFTINKLKKDEILSSIKDENIL